MRVDLPQCGFKNCKFSWDGNCLYRLEYKRCEHRLAIETLENIIGAQKLCILCKYSGCDHKVAQGTNCSPLWNGLGAK